MRDEDGEESRVPADRKAGDCDENDTEASRAPAPLTLGDAAKELLGDRMVQAILVAAALLGALEMGFFG